MAGTRSSTRNAGTSSSPKQEKNTVAGEKRKAENSASPQSKRERKATKKQTTIEETLAGDKDEGIQEDSEMKESPGEEEGPSEADIQGMSSQESKNGDDGSAKSEESNGAGKVAANGESAIEESSEREKNMPSSILEKGIIYFFVRNRVGIEEAESVGDLQRTYFVLRPLSAGTRLGDGALPDLENNRLFALPKKVLPKSHHDRFMAFVEKITTIQDLKDNFFKGEEYDTKTMGTRHTEPVTTVGEGVYAITRTEDRTTHLAYAITIPSSLGEVQEELGLRSQGSFIMSVKNPERPGPASARLPQSPEFPKDIIEEFRGLAWTEAKPKYLNYANCQILLIGESLESATEPTAKDKKHHKETPKEELEQLEHEDELRVEHLHGDDSIFDDLNISKKDYPQVLTTW